MKINIVKRRGKLTEWPDMRSSHLNFNDYYIYFYPTKTNHFVYYAFHENKIVGLYSFYCCRGVLYSSGTYVAKGYQKYGIATKLWSNVLKDKNIHKIKVSVISDRGYTLVKKLQKKYSKIKWAISEAGNRKLRDLRK